MPGNELVDAEAKEATKLPGPLHSSRSNAMRRSRESVLSKWTAQWQMTINTGRFAEANRLPPRMKPRDHFVDLPRKLYGRVTQCRLGHAFLGEYYSTHVPSEPVDCPCGAPLQTRTHLLRDCHDHDEAREILYEFSPNLSITDILGSEKGIVALAKFLQASDTFSKSSVV